MKGQSSSSHPSTINWALAWHSTAKIGIKESSWLQLLTSYPRNPWEISWSCVLSCFMSVASGSTALNRRQGKQMSIASAERHFPQDCCKAIVGYILLRNGHVFNRQSYQLCDWFLGFLMFPCILTRSDPFSQSKTIHYYLGPSKLFRLESRDV